VKFCRKRFLHLAAIGVLFILLISTPNHGAWSQTTRTIKVVVPVPPGGSTDFLARLVTDQIGRSARTDNWAKTQRLSRSEAIRLLIDDGLRAKGKR
jgi:tripartite-type tricarboxylate transporter receptor subunit TctC